MRTLLLFLTITLFSSLSFGQDCNPVAITGGNGQITVTGLTGAPIIGIQVFNSSWASVFNESYTNQPGTVNVPLSAGQYFVTVRFYTANWASICEKTSSATVTSGPPPSADTCGATFLKTFGGLAGNDEAFNIVKSSDGGYITVGQSAVSGNTNNDGLVMKFDSKGSLLWSKTLGGAQEDFLANAVATPDGGCLAAGTTNSNGPASFVGDAWLVRLDGSGNVLWQKKYFVSGSPGDITGIIQTSDGGFAFTGSFPFTPGLSDWMVVKIDINGNILWQRKLGTSNSDGGNSIVEDNHGGAGLVVCGIVLSGSWYDAVISKLDLTTGSLLWTKAWDFDSKANWPGPIFKVADGFVMNARSATGYGIENSKPAILKTDFSGNLMWIKEYTIGSSVKESRVTPLPDGSFMMSQGELPRDATTDIHLMRIDANGNVMWSKKYTRPGTQWFYGLMTDGNSVVGAGLATTGSYSDLMLGRTDFNGKLGTCTPENVTVNSRNCVVTNLNFTWPTNVALNLGVANTVYTAASTSPVENVLCSDGCPTVTVGNATVNENAGNAVVQVCIGAPAASTLVYNYITSNGSATAGADYTGGPGTVTILAGQTCGTISIPITNDTDIESAETFTVTVGGVSGTVTINDDDQALSNCAGVTITPGSNQITVTGVTAPVATVQVFNSNWVTVFNQTYNNAPGTVVVNIGPGNYLVKVTFYTSGWSYVCDKSENVTVVNNCPPNTICISNFCPTQTVDLYDAYNIPNLPAGTVVSWHTGTPATDANRMTEQQARNVSVAGTYYAAINISGGNCYSATITVNVTIVPCNPTTAPVTTSTLTEKNNIVQLKSADQPSTRSIMAFPNPFTRSLRVIIDSEKQDRVTITLMDVQGKELRQMPVTLSPGSNAVLLEGLDRYPSGSYFLKISSASGVKTLKVVRQQ